MGQPLSGRRRRPTAGTSRGCHVYLSTPDNLHVKNHLAVRDVLRSRCDLRDEDAAIKAGLAVDPEVDINTYIARKSAVLQKMLAESDLRREDLVAIRRLNDPQGNS
ncbi:MAG: GrpB family protein [Ornithinimicrobium sp.]|uniref:GrpB family protein n=1 Tax=Ornithinimicrobium sp. TaxID=1977084 RepID=UPI0026DEF75C|nr:GrpB family protein [Ornithinimicrobium sp.]MDO5739305.1 GrpB family protein [Ornithinimicrobium sp.]